MPTTPKATTLKNSELKQYRAIAHRLNPVVMIGGQGVSDGVLAELDRALKDHELIKLKIA
ncbi:MAG: YhbY family RNA-binding protein, partial [Cellvibrionales bacterium]|nr:YhbY family RNA-binding protein [Cellvibrionales bacterium]